MNFYLNGVQQTMG